MLNCFSQFLFCCRMNFQLCFCLLFSPVSSSLRTEITSHFHFPLCSNLKPPSSNWRYPHSREWNLPGSWLSRHSSLHPDTWHRGQLTPVPGWRIYSGLWSNESLSGWVPCSSQDTPCQWWHQGGPGQVCHSEEAASLTHQTPPRYNGLGLELSPSTNWNNEKHNNYLLLRTGRHGAYLLLMFLAVSEKPHCYICQCSDH